MPIKSKLIASHDANLLFFFSKKQNKLSQLNIKRRQSQ